MTMDAAQICEHLSASFAIRPEEILEWYDGPIVAAVRCGRCESCGLLECLDWDVSTKLRIYALRPLPRAALDLYLRNREKGTCDPARPGAELYALLCAAGAPARLLAYDVANQVQVANRPFPPDEQVSAAPWRERIPARDDTRWFRLAGVPKSGRH
jgi:hypothetical protein